LGEGYRQRSREFKVVFKCGQKRSLVGAKKKRGHTGGWRKRPIFSQEMRGGLEKEKQKDRNDLEQKLGIEGPGRREKEPERIPGEENEITRWGRKIL